MVNQTQLERELIEESNKHVYIDVETGSVFDNLNHALLVHKEIQQEKNEQKNNGFVQLTQHITPYLFTKLTKSAINVLAYFLDNLEMQDHNTIMVSQATMAKDLGISRQSIGKGVECLEEYKIIATAKIGQANLYLINPHIAWQNGRKEKNKMRLKASAILSKEENEKIFAEFEQIEMKSLKNPNGTRVKIQNDKM